MVLTLHILNGARQGARIALRSPGRYVLGSAASADVRIAPDDDRYVSSQHAVIEVDASGSVIRSMAALNPLTVNGEGVARRTLNNGDVLQVGLTRFAVERLLPVCFRCGATDDALTKSAESDDHFAELNDVATYAHAACVRPDPQVSGRRLGRFTVLRKLGQGGFGVVWMVHDPATSRVWALKQLRTAPDDTLARFLREGRFLTQHTHPMIVRCVEIGEADDAGMYLLCEYVEGEDLSRYLARNGRQTETWTIDVMRPMLIALDFLHTRTGVIVHRDVKPANVLLHRPSPQSADLKVKLADLGIARALEGPGSTRLTANGGIAGTPEFLAPEVWSAAPYTPVADIYSVGVTAYRALTGALPYDYVGEMDQRFGLHVLTHDTVPIRRRLPSVSPRLAEAVDTACRRNPSDRYPTAEAFARALLEAKAGLTEGANEQLPRPESPSKPSGDRHSVETIRQPPR
jgi:Protein kinase domain/Inner membrane component of T3SS, cytoplasmic domain